MIPDREKPLTKLELDHLIAIVRRYRDRMRQSRLELTERRRSGINGQINEAILALDNELALLSFILAKLCYQSLIYKPPPPSNPVT